MKDQWNLWQLYSKVIKNDVLKNSLLDLMDWKKLFVTTRSTCANNPVTANHLVQTRETHCCRITRYMGKLNSGKLGTADNSVLEDSAQEIWVQWKTRYGKIQNKKPGYTGKLGARRFSKEFAVEPSFPVLSYSIHRVILEPKVTIFFNLLNRLFHMISKTMGLRRTKTCKDWWRQR